MYIKILPEVLLGDMRGNVNTEEQGPLTRWPQQKSGKSTEKWKYETVKLKMPSNDNMLNLLLPT